MERNGEKNPPHPAGRSRRSPTLEAKRCYFPKRGCPSSSCWWFHTHTRCLKFSIFISFFSGKPFAFRLNTHTHTHPCSAYTWVLYGLNELFWNSYIPLFTVLEASNIFFSTQRVMTSLSTFAGAVFQSVHATQETPLWMVWMSKLSSS